MKGVLDIETGGFSITKNGVCEIAKEKHKLPSYKLGDLCNHFGILNTDEHSALGDALVTLTLFFTLNK